MNEAIARIRAWMGVRGISRVVLTTPGNVAWATGGANIPIDRSAATDTLWIVVTSTNALLIAADVERDRLTAEFELDFEPVWVPWFDAEAYVRAALGSADPRAVATDGFPAFALDVSDELTALRMTLSSQEQAAMRRLGADAATAVEHALQQWSPGDRDRDVQAAISAEIEKFGGDTPVLIVGGDDRVRRFRHPLAMGAPMHELVMAAAVVRRGGIHVALTRYAGQRPPLESVKRIECSVLEACRPGRRFGDVLKALDHAYQHEGAYEGWRQHYQGGPIGFNQREFEIAPSQVDSHWYSHPVEIGQAMAWNPSLPGGSKTEDTYLITDSGPELVTASSISTVSSTPKGTT